MALSLPSGDLYAENMSVEDLIELEGGYTAAGFNLIPKNFLLGVPLVVTGLRFQPIIVPEKGPNKGVKPRGYVTCEAAVYPELDVKRQVTMGRVVHYLGDRKFETAASLEDLKVAPTERIVFNDGSTGIRRQIVQLLHNNGFIQVVPTPKIDERDPILDTPWDEWTNIGVQRTMIGEIEAPYICRSYDGAKPLTIRCPRGLRVSDYENPTGQGDIAETYYLG